MTRTIALLCALTLGPLGVAEASPPTPLFELEAAALQAEGSDGTEEVEVLFEEHRWDLDAQGRWTQIWRRRFVVRSEKAAQGMAMLEQPWVPERESRPEIRARVVDHGGRLWTADPSSFQEAVDTGDDPNIVQDTRTIRVPLPGMAPGSVIEQEVVTREKVSLSRAGRALLLPPFLGLPTRIHRLVVSAPRGMGLHSTQPSHVTVTTTEVDGREELLFDVGDGRPGPDAGWPQTPDTLRLAPYVRVGTSATWPEVSADYHRTLAGVSTRGLGALIERVRAGASDDERIALATAIARDEVRYTSIAFGLGRVVPRPPSTTHGSSFGDCKDKALLLATLLDAVDVEARVALVSTRDSIPFDEALPGLDLFDHAIVYLPGRDQWIDATSDTSAAGELPWMDQGRPALLVHPTEGALVHTPEQPATYEVTTRARLDAPGRAQLHEHTAATGWAAARMLGSLGSSTEQDRTRTLTEYARKRYGADGVTVELSTEPGPATLDIHASGSTAVSANSRGGKAHLDLSSIVEQLEPALRHQVQDRTAPLDGVPTVHRATVEVQMPDGYTLDHAPEPGHWTIGDAELRRTIDIDGASLRATLTLDTGDGDFAAHELVTLQEALGEGATLPDLTWTAPGYGDGAVTRLEALLAVPSPDGATSLEIATLLMNLGLREAARPFARSAADALPDSAHAQGLAGLLLSQAADPAAKGYLRAGADLDPYWLNALLAWALIGPDHEDDSGDEDAELRDQVYATLAAAGPVDEELARGVWVAWQKDGRWADLLADEQVPPPLKSAARYMTGEPTHPAGTAPALALIGAGHEEGFALLNQLPAAQLPTFYRGVRHLLDLGDTPTSATQAAALAFGAVAAGDPEAARTWLVGGADRFRSDLLEGAGLMGGDLSGTDAELQRRLMHTIVLSSETEAHGDTVWGSLPVGDNHIPLFVAWTEGDAWKLSYPAGDGLAVLLGDHLREGRIDEAAALANWAWRIRPEPVRTGREVLAIQGLALLASDAPRGVELLKASEQPWAPYDGLKVCGSEWPCLLALTEAFPDPELQFVRAVALAESGDPRRAKKLARSLTGVARDRALATALMAKGDWKGLEDVIDRGQVDVNRWTNDLAWGLLLDGRAAEALPHAERSLAIGRNPPLLHTVASAYVQLGRFDDAAELIAEVDTMLDEPDPDWAYVEARIAEHVGLDAEPIWARLDAEVPDGPRSTRRLPRK